MSRAYAVPLAADAFLVRQDPRRESIRSLLTSTNEADTEIVNYHATTLLLSLGEVALGSRQHSVADLRLYASAVNTLMLSKLVEQPAALAGAWNDVCAAEQYTGRLEPVDLPTVKE
jgi:hypothetical protein